MPLVLGLFFPVAVFCFALGLVLPLVQLEKLYFFTETPSLIQIAFGLMRGGDILLGGAVFVFSVLFPALKLLVLGVACVQGGASRWVRYVSVLGKWSMMDVMLVALVVFAAKTSGLAFASVQTGLVAYAGAALLSALCAALCQRLA
ncbi:paraquat-inducible protein A [Polycladidibacter hongkongensis]|uniref:paraquat-inducible protein A n=1 Tax=Polycladidibacter hongkongensis TaxID=1647556 RepID=UPI00082BA296|nr:paraquat-inducible protein A [Pseudovibrio hongkongensis]